MAVSCRQDLLVTQHIALLRGINVGGSRRVAMADVRALMTGMGYTGISTYLQWQSCSGNAVFTAAAQPADVMAAAIGDRIAANLGADVQVVIRTSGQLADIVAGNPLRHVRPVGLDYSIWPCLAWAGSPLEIIAE
jgi:uncharacterized protein (DUF1697 family)